ncbi:hypothetical protein A9Q94_06530 [Rhodobacterales bacterium 56_14_T64]|nr:hypothetical protein A9Q94_06530 [Rhodobacterales bacterium 56_14_T64]
MRQPRERFVVLLSDFVKTNNETKIKKDISHVFRQFVQDNVQVVHDKIGTEVYTRDENAWWLKKISREIGSHLSKYARDDVDNALSLFTTSSVAGMRRPEIFLVYYWFHTCCSEKSYAEEIDAEVFPKGSFEAQFGEPVLSANSANEAAEQRAEPAVYHALLRETQSSTPAPLVASISSDKENIPSQLATIFRDRKWIFSAIGLTVASVSIIVSLTYKTPPNISIDATLEHAIEALRSENKREYIRLINKAHGAGNVVATAALSVAYDTGYGVSKDLALSEEYGLEAQETGIETAAQNDPIAQFFLAQMYLRGISFEEDENHGISLLRSSKVGGYVRASLQLANEAYDTETLTDDCSGKNNAQLAAEQGHIAASRMLGVYIFHGKCSSKDDELALAQFRIAAEGGDQVAKLDVAWMYDHGRGVPQDEETAVEIYRELAKLGNARAQNALGWMYQEGRGVGAQSDHQAVNWYQKSANQNNVQAQSNLGWMYESGRGVEAQSDAQAVFWYQKAADQDNARAQTNLGRMYREGRGVEAQSDAQAVFWYQKAADQDYARAQTNLGWMYKEGRGVEAQSDAQAVFWYQKAADQDYARAQTNLGWMYKEGRGVEAQSDAQAVFWYQKAADQDYTRAQTNLGWMYESGLGVDAQSDTQAVFWYQKAADQGYARAQTNLGWMYKEGRGVEAQSDAQAVFWYRKAADQDYARAQTNLGWMIVNGEHKDADDSEAFSLFAQGASQDNKWSLTSLGMAYLYGHGTEVSIPLAAKLCRRGVESNTNCADYCVGLSYFKQDLNDPVVEREEAEQSLIKAASQNHHCAATLLGLAYVFEDFPSSNKVQEAEKWFRTAAEIGPLSAKYNLGLFLNQFKQQPFSEGSEAFSLILEATEQSDTKSACAVANYYLKIKNNSNVNYMRAAKFLSLMVDRNEISEDIAGSALREQYELSQSYLSTQSLSYSHPDFTSNELEDDYRFGAVSQLVEQVDDRPVNVR